MAYTDNAVNATVNDNTMKAVKEYQSYIIDDENIYDAKRVIKTKSSLNLQNVIATAEKMNGLQNAIMDCERRIYKYVFNWMQYDNAMSEYAIKGDCAMR